MYLYYLVGIACLPVILLCMFIYKKDNDKEPKKLLRKLFLFGIGTIIPILILELIVDGIISTDNNSNLVLLFIATFVGVGLIEEGAKWVVTNKCIYNDPEFNHAYDAIVYAVFASLGFALIENILYVVQLGFGIGLLRAIITVPSHACDGVFMGYFIGKARQESFNNNQTEANKNMLYSLLFPIIAHTLFDYFIFSQRGILLVVFILYTIAMFVVSFILVNKVSKINYNFDGSTLENKMQVLNSDSSKKSFNYALTRMLIVSGIMLVFSIFMMSI